MAAPQPWTAQDAVLIDLWRKGVAIHEIIEALAQHGPPRTQGGIYARLATLRGKGIALKTRPRGARRGASRPAAESAEQPAETTTRIDELGRTVTVCPPRWCAGARRSQWER